MSTDVENNGGGKAAAEAMVRQTRDLVAERRSQEEQLSLLEPVSPEEMARAQEALGPNAGGLAVLDHARASKAGRKPGSRNRKTEDFDRYIRQFGRDPAITLMEIQSTPPEVLVERSKLMDTDKRRMSYGDAQALRTRCAEALMPYMHGKKPISVDLNAKGDFNLIIPGVNMSESDAQRAAAGSFVLDAEYRDVEAEPDT